MAMISGAIAAAVCLTHVTESLKGLMPTSLSLVGTAEQVVLVSTESSRTIATHGVHLTSAGDAEDIRVFAHHLLSDVQDLVVCHLGTPWPSNADGAPLSVWTSRTGDTIHLGFARAGASVERPDVALPDFACPRPGARLTAG